MSLEACPLSLTFGPWYSICTSHHLGPLQVYSLGVFLSTAWSSWQPTSEEYATAYDLPVQLEFFGWDKSGALPFVSTTPSKILMSFHEAIVADTEQVRPKPQRPTPREEIPLSPVT
jgi:hypothetical protein